MLSWSKLLSTLLGSHRFSKTVGQGHCDLLVDDRNECGYPGISQVECEDRNCCWIPFPAEDIRNPPWCSNPASRACGYIQIGPNQLKDRCNSTRLADILVTYINNDILRVEISRKEDEFHVPESLYPDQEANYTDGSSSSLKYLNFSDKYGNFNFKIMRSDMNETIWNTELQNNLSATSIVMKLMYTQIGTILPSNHSIYGLGYNYHKLKIPPDSTIALFARDSSTLTDRNLYGAHPFYMRMEKGKAHGVYLRNSFGMDAIVEANSIKFKMLGGPIDLLFFAGPKPLDVMEQYTRIVGRPAMFDYRILGFHQSRYGYKNTDEIINVIENYRKAQIPLDNIWLDIDYMENKKSFTIDPVSFRMSNLTAKLSENNLRLIPILDPGIKVEAGYEAYEKGLAMEVYVKNPQNYDSKYYEGVVWPGKVNFIDFTSANATEYCKHELDRFFGLFNCSTEVIGGLWLDMNEPSNFIDGHNYTFPDMPADYNRFSSNFPRYLINNEGHGAPIYKGTIPMDTICELGDSYQTHNLYGFFESKVIYESLSEMLGRNRRPFLLTRSTFPGSGRFSATWLGDNYSTFEQMALSIVGVLQYGLEGIPVTGPDICGFLGEADEELCARWMALGSFYPFARNHNSNESKIDQEPYRWPAVSDVSKKYLQIRYSLLPYFYTLMHEAHETGAPLWRPIFFYDESAEALDIEDQFMLGDALLISPALKRSLKQMIVRLPRGEWYEYETMEFVKTSKESIRILYSTPINFIPIHFKAGNILIRQDPRLTMTETRNTGFNLLIGLNSCGFASGKLYWDDGQSFEVKNDDFINLKIEARFRKWENLTFTISGHDGMPNRPRVHKMIVLTAGYKILLKNSVSNPNRFIKAIDEGFEVTYEGEGIDIENLKGEYFEIENDWLRETLAGIP